MSKPVYRLATVDDLAQLVELRVLMQKEVNDLNESEVAPEYCRAVRQYFKESFGNGSYVSAVAEIDAKLVSVNGLVIYDKPPSISGGMGRVGYVSNVYSLPEWRGRGIASAVMKFLVEYARLNQIEKLHLGTTDLGKGVYERVGFRPPHFLPLELKL